MSLAGIGAVSITPGVSSTSASASASGGGALPYSLSATSAGAYIAQGGGNQSNGSSLLRKVLTGAVVGAGVGFGASFITPLLNLVPHAKIILPAAGAAIGALGGLVMHLIGRRRQNLAMQAQAQALQQQAMQPVQLSGAALRAGARGPAARRLQADLQAIGLYDGKLTGAFDRRTMEAVRRYEVMKGVMPTGKGSAELRAAVSQDAALVRQYT